VRKPGPHDLGYYISAASSPLLDIGCNTGELMQYALELGVSEAHGVDINRAATDQARAKFSSDNRATVTHTSADDIPLDDSSVVCIVCSEVLEHVPAELRRGVIAEALRVIRPGGRLIITVPHHGIFDFMDPANVRFHFPRLFAGISRQLGGGGRDAGFEGEKHGVVRHHHFTVSELTTLLSPHFSIKKIRYRGAFVFPFCEWIQFPFYRMGGVDTWLFRVVAKIQELDYRIPWTKRLAYNVLVVASPIK